VIVLEAMSATQSRRCPIRREILHEVGDLGAKERMGTSEVCIIVILSREKASPRLSESPRIMRGLETEFLLAEMSSASTVVKV
jgi:hypothetical protein